MLKQYAKVKGEAVVKYPYGFDDLQAEFDQPLVGDISFIDRFNQSPAAQDHSLVEVTKDDRKSIPLPSGQRPVFGDIPVLTDGVWVLPLVGMENPPARPNDGNYYVWNMDLRNWQQIPAHHIPQG